MPGLAQLNPNVRVFINESCPHVEIHIARRYANEGGRGMGF